MRRIVPLVMAGLLAGCTDQLAARQAYLSQFIGQPKFSVVQAMGVPTRNFETGGVTYLAYNEHRIDFIPGPPTFAPWSYGGYGALHPRWCNSIARRRSRSPMARYAHSSCAVTHVGEAHTGSARVNRATNGLTQLSQTSSTRVSKYPTATTSGR